MSKTNQRKPRRTRGLPTGLVYAGVAILASMALLLWLSAATSGTASNPEQFASPSADRARAAGMRAPTAVATEGLTVPNGFHDFGRISMADGRVTHRYTVSNAGDRPVHIDKLFTSCMCTEATLLTGSGERIGPFGMPGHGYLPPVDRNVAPGETVTVVAVFDPAAHGPAGVGRADRAVYVQTGPKSGLQLQFTANVVP